MPANPVIAPEHDEHSGHPYPLARIQAKVRLAHASFDGKGQIIISLKICFPRTRPADRRNHAAVIPFDVEERQMCDGGVTADAEVLAGAKFGI